MKKHGMRNSKEYKAWSEAKQRCHNEKNTRFKWYGGRGIAVCEEWRGDFLSFYEHTGPCPDGYELDRIDNNKGYEPGNVRWVSKRDNIRNRSITVFVECNGERMLLSDYAEKEGLEYGTAWNRAKNYPHLINGKSHRPKGVNNRNAKLDDEKVWRIRNCGEPTKLLAMIYGVSQSLIQQVRKGEGWGHVKRDNKMADCAK